MMHTIGIRDLQINPAILTKALESKEYTMITKRSTPIGIAVALDDNILSKGLKTSLLIDGYKSGNISLGQLAKNLNISKQKTMHLLDMMGIDCVEYDFKDDIQTLSKFI
jgi:predicted HTH domain antitoxin